SARLVLLARPPLVVLGRDHEGILDPKQAPLDALAQIADVGDRNRAVKDQIDDPVFTGLDALGDLDLPFAGEQGDRAHFAQIHADGVDAAPALVEQPRLARARALAARARARNHGRLDGALAVAHERLPRLGFAG